MEKAEPWQTAEIPGPKKALLITKTRVVSEMIKRMKRPIIIVGHESLKGNDGEGVPIDFTIRIARAGRIPLTATAHIVGEFVKRGFQPDAFMPVVDIGNRLRDPDWKGFDGVGQYDLALFLGLPYYVGWLILSGLKHFALHGDIYLKTISLERFYQPHASWSFPNLSAERWMENLKKIAEELEER